MGNALVNGDYKTFVQFTYPKILKDMGGKEKMAANIERQMQEMAAQGSRVISISYGEPSATLREGAELQCTIPRSMVLQTSQGKILSKSTLIAISKDKGSRWYFVDAGERDFPTIRRSLPNLSKSLHLEKPAQPKLLPSDAENHN